MRAIFLSLVLCSALLPVGVLFAEDNGAAVLPNGRELRPAGAWVPLAPYPFALSVRPDGRQIVIPSIGFPFALNVISDPAATTPTVQRMPAENRPAPGTRKHDSENDPSIEVHAASLIHLTEHYFTSLPVRSESSHYQTSD